VASTILPVEVRGALRRRAAEHTIDADRLQNALQQLAADRSEWTLVVVSARILERAEQMVSHHELRALDAIHIASAQEFGSPARGPVPFVSADRRQIAAATAAGLFV